MEQTIDAGGRLVLPREVREATGLRPGTVAEVRIVKEGVLLVPKGRRQTMDDLVRYLERVRKTDKVRLSKEEILELCDRALEDL